MSECMMPAAGIAQQRLHVDAGAEVLEAALGVLAWWWPGCRARPAPSSSPGSENITAP